MGDAFVQKGPETDLTQMFTVSQAAAVTGLSRSTVLRMEDRGLLEPAGYIRAEAIVGPPLGRDVDMSKYRCRLILPVEG